MKPKKSGTPVGGTMPQEGPAMKMQPKKGKGMDVKPEGEMVQVRAHARAKHVQKHPAKPSQPADMKWI